VDGGHEYSLFAAVHPIEKTPPSAEILADILDRSGNHHSYVLWFPEEGSVVVPFDPNAALETLWGEEYVTDSRRTVLPETLMAFYYAIRPLLPASSRIHLRRLILGRHLPERRLLEWPSDDSLDSLQRLMLRLLMLASGRKSLRFTWFWPNGHSWAAVLTHDVETANGLARVLDVAELERQRGFRSLFNFVPRDYEAPAPLLSKLREDGFEIGVHGYTHDGLMFSNPRIFGRRAPAVNQFGRQWNAVGFRSPATYRNWAWIGLLEFEYDSSVADSSPFEPQPGGCGSCFPYFIDRMIELPVTLPQDHTLFGLLRQRNAEQWFSSLDRIRNAHGMACVLTHPDPERGYIGQATNETHYRDLLDEIAGSDAWIPLPRDLAQWWRVRAEASPQDIGRIAGLSLGTAVLDECGRLKIVPSAHRSA
jgi:peptidoglycan/xylan/chitin deacetylase (PgdA/CDA1 family)